jgi:type I restriction enzyme S subunit
MRWLRNRRWLPVYFGRGAAIGGLMPIEFCRDGPWEIPVGWVWTRLGDIAHVNPSTPFDDLPAELEIPFVPMAAMAEETGVVDLSQRRHVAQLKQGYTRFQTGDVLFAKITPCMENGKSAPITDLPLGYGAGSTEFHVIRSRLLDPRYLWYWLVRQAFRGDAERNMSGSAGQMRVPVDYLRDTKIAIPPTAEQRRIVTRIDELFTEIADGETALTRARDDLDTWRRALLKAAVTGELTREWREGNKPNETGADLAERARAEKARASIGMRRGRRAELADVDQLSLDELPQTWTSATFGELFNLYTGSTPSRSKADYWGGDIPWVSSGEVAFCRITDTAEKITAAGLEASSTRLHPVGTVLLAMIGEGKTRGQPAILDIEASNNQNAAAIRVSETSIVPEFVFDFLSYRYEKTRRAGQGGNQPALNLGKVSQIRMPVPPLAEMREIARIVGELRSAMEDVELAPQMAAKDAQKLRQSILKAAFEGRLVEQDPSDEPAEGLLARLNDDGLRSVPASGRRARRAVGAVGADA